MLDRVKGPTVGFTDSRPVIFKKETESYSFKHNLKPGVILVICVCIGSHQSSIQISIDPTNSLGREIWRLDVEVQDWKSVLFIFVLFVVPDKCC